MGMSKVLGLIAVAGLVLLWFLFGQVSKPRIIVKERVTPEPHSIAKVRELDHFKTLASCNFASHRIAGDSTLLKALTGELVVSLPGRWTVTTKDTIKVPFRTPQIIYTSERESLVSIAHDPSSSGLSFEADPVTEQPRPARNCESVMDSSGTIWSLYPPDTRTPGPVRRPRFTALGDAVTAKGRRYKLRIGSWSESERDSLAAIISSAVVSR